MSVGLEEFVLQAEACVDQEAEQPTASFKPPTPADIGKWNTTQAPEYKWLFKDLMERNSTMGLAAQGGTGKSSLLLLAAVSAAVGRPFVDVFTPVEPVRVLALFGEDSENEVWRRYRRMLRVYEVTAEESERIANNCRIYCGSAFPFMQATPAPTSTEAFLWLLSEVSEFKPDFVIVDPKSQFFGLSENDNGDTSQWYVNLKRLYEANPCAVIVAMHTSKQKENDLDSAASRGGSANRDDVRVMLNLAPVSASDVSTLGIENPALFCKGLISKANYTRRTAEEIIFQRCTDTPGTPEDQSVGGVLKQLDTRQRLAEVADAQCAGLARVLVRLIGMNQANLSVADISERPAGKGLRDVAKDECGSKEATGAKIRASIDHAIDRGWLVMDAVSGGAGMTRSVPRIGGANDGE